MPRVRDHASDTVQIIQPQECWLPLGDQQGATTVFDVDGIF